MDTRAPIQVSLEPCVHSISFDESSARFICGLDNGIRVFRANDCIRTIKESPGPGSGVAVAALLDDRYIAIVGGGRSPNSSPNIVQFWDNVEAKKLNELDFAEPVLGIRITTTSVAVILAERTVVLQYAKHNGSNLVGPAAVVGLHRTANNLNALCSIRGDRMALPGLTPGQVQLLGLKDRSKNIIRAHSSELRQLDLSNDGQLLATASKQGTLIRVFSTSTLSQTHEFRRGVDPAIIYSLSISPANQFIASTSDSGTLHIFDLRPPSSDETKPAPRKRVSTTRPSATSRNRPSPCDFDALSLPSASTSPRTAGGFYGPPPDLAHAPPSSGPSVVSAIARFPGMPRAFSDARSMTSISYHMGTDPPNWQGQPRYLTTTLPNGQTGKVANPNVPIPGLPHGRPPKGALAWDPRAGDRRLWCVGGGTDARWESFVLHEGDDGRLRLGKEGWRAFLTRQFPEEG